MWSHKLNYNPEGMHFQWQIPQAREIIRQWVASCGLQIPLFLYSTYLVFSLRKLDRFDRRCNKRRLTASDCQEGNRRDYSMSGNQTSGKEGGVQCVMTVVCIYA